ncbi:hypothetical protein HY407_04825 [Candidatus Gottesmanbacteria bacterium]|nr:hypothetical protein [Candidatus Gottesmanbacteria bacterium]
MSEACSCTYARDNRGGKRKRIHNPRCKIHGQESHVTDKGHNRGIGVGESFAQEEEQRIAQELRGSLIDPYAGDENQ